ncbi:hypothetical protein FTW19_09515 [Terriglobus albidus]|uniref:Uncharacterized protein n=2 Tax=Terriglobus albidus TaxID=1592106 RepID=A0A5B9E7G8_9BACT|nr:hypothetical protein FTW19_09515 [Terriglobus albidus]
MGIPPRHRPTNRRSRAFSLRWVSRKGCAAAFSLRKTPIDAEALLYTYRENALWFVRSKPDFSGWRILVSRCVDHHLQPPTESPIAAPGLEADPHFTPDGRTLYFISSRSTGAGLDIWTAIRSTVGTWQTPVKLPEPVNSNEAEWFPRPPLTAGSTSAPVVLEASAKTTSGAPARPPTEPGWSHFPCRCSPEHSHLWAFSVMKTPLHAPSGIPRNRENAPENADPGLNTADAEYEFLPASNNQWGLLATDKGIFIREFR